MTAINVSTDFTRFPSGRFKKNGSTSGEAFREQFLEKPISEGQKIVVVLDGTVGYGSSFLEEAFGGLVRKLKVSADRVLSLLDFQASDTSLVDEIKQYVRDADSTLNR
jgi:STAS-like domain of unknown function (DUF4325)